MPVRLDVVGEDLRRDAETLWEYHDLRSESAEGDVGVGLGSHDSDVATLAAELYFRGLFPRILFTGGHGPRTTDLMRRGEAMHYRDRALRAGVPDEAILVEPYAGNTGENIEFARKKLVESGVRARSVVLVTRPYHRRRAFATCKKLWPEVEVVTAARQTSLADYVEDLGDVELVLSTLVGETQRVTVYAERGFTIPQPVPVEVRHAYRRLAEAGYTHRLLRE